jgi:hypothetical protein
MERLKTELGGASVHELSAGILPHPRLRPRPLPPRGRGDAVVVADREEMAGRRELASGHLLLPVFQTGTTARIVSCGGTGTTDNDDEYLATRAVREGLRREIRQKIVGSLKLLADKANRSGRN